MGSAVLSHELSVYRAGPFVSVVRVVGRRSGCRHFVPPEDLQKT